LAAAVINKIELKGLVLAALLISGEFQMAQSTNEHRREGMGLQAQRIKAATDQPRCPVAVTAARRERMALLWCEGLPLWAQVSPII
jgi:hypothetical protein